MMIRDMDIAAELMGVRPLYAKLSAFAVSSYLCGVAGAMFVFFYLGAAEPSAFSITLSFQVLFMVILGGLGSLVGSFFGAAFIWILPILLRAVPPMIGIPIAAETATHVTSMIIGALIVVFLVARAARAGSSVADRQGEAQGVALPLCVRGNQQRLQPQADTLRSGLRALSGS